MTEREYPRWVHREGHPKDSVVVETAEEETAQLAAWNAIDGSTMKVGNKLTFETSPFENASKTAVVTAVADSAPARKGGWPKGKPRSPRQAAVN